MSQGPTDDDVATLQTGQTPSKPNDAVRPSPDNEEYLCEEHSSATYAELPHGFELAVILLSLFFSLLLASLEQSIVSTASPTIASEFNVLDQIGWIATAYLLPMTSFQPLFGKLADVFGRKMTLLVSTAIFLVGSGLAGIAQNMTMLCIMRGIQGVGAAGITPLVMIILGEVVPLEQRGNYQGLVALCWATGTIGGPTVGGMLVEWTSWRWIFLINLPVGMCTMASIIYYLPESKVTCTEEDDSFAAKLLRIDFLGATLFVSAVACFLLATQWAGTSFAWSHPVTIGLYSMMILFLILAILVEKYVSRDPFIHLDLFKNRDNVALYIMVFFYGCAFFAGIYYFPVFFQVAHDDSPTASGLEILAFLLPVDVTSVVTGVLLSATGIYRPTFWIGSICIIIGGGLCSLFSFETGLAQQICSMLITGIGIGAIIQNVYVVGQSNVSDAEIAPAVSLVSFMAYFGFASGTAISNAIFNNVLIDRLVALGLSKDQILQALASPNFVRAAPPELKAPLLDAYLKSLHYVFISMAIYGVLTLIGSLAMSPKRIRKPGIYLE